MIQFTIFPLDSEWSQTNKQIAWLVSDTKKRTIHQQFPGQNDCILEHSCLFQIFLSKRRRKSPNEKTKQKNRKLSLLLFSLTSRGLVLPNLENGKQH